jgi:acetyl esterase/lipase
MIRTSRRRPHAAPNSLEAQEARCIVSKGRSWAFFLSVLFSGFVPVEASADTIEIPISEINKIVSESPQTSREAIRTFFAQKLQEQLDRLGLNNNSSGLVFDDIPVGELNRELTSNCPVPIPYEVHAAATTAAVTLNPTSAASFNLNSIMKLSVLADLSGHLSTATDASVKWGQDVPFAGDCRRIATDDGRVSVTLPFRLQLTLSAELTPRYDRENIGITVDKHAVLTGQASIERGDISADFGKASPTEALVNALEDHLLDKLRERGTEQFNKAIARFNNKLNGLSDNGIADPTIEAFNGPTTFVVQHDQEDAEAVRSILEALGVPELVISLANDRGAEIILQLAMLDEGERDAYLARLGADVGCTALRNTFEVPMQTAPLYALNEQGCVKADVFGAALGRYFTDEACTSEVAFRPADANEFCMEQLDDGAGIRLGNAASWTPDENQASDPLPGVPSRKWTATLGTDLGIGILPIEENQQPFMKQINYKTVVGLPRGNGTCQLELRVYKSDLAARNLKPLLAIHGGTWASRGLSFFGLEASVSQFTERGFIVFAPFYRLVGDGDGNSECNGATWRELTADVEDALQWVRDHGEALGASRDRVTVFGQSAGAHLAAWLAAYRPNSVRKALLFYAPTDVLGFLRGAVPIDGPYQSFREYGLRALAHLYGAANGSAELRLDAIDYAALDPTLLAGNPNIFIPDEVFDLSMIDTLAPPNYLARCAQLTQTDLLTVNLAQPPEALMNCLKEHLSEFLVDNSMDLPLSGGTVPLYSVHGTGDSLVPYEQAVALCSAISATALPNEVIDDVTTYECNPRSRASIVKGAEHALDLGLCAGPVCPAGPPGSLARAATAATVEASYQWLTVDP